MRCALAWLLLAGCAPQSFELSLDTPAAHAAAIAELHLDVLRPSAGAIFHCDDLAYGRVDAATALRSKEREVILRAESEAALGDLERAGLHVFLATAYTAEGARALVGCAEAEPLQDEVLLLALEPAVSVELLDDTGLGGVWGQAAPPPLRARVMNAFDEPAQGVRAVWSTSWKGGTDDSGTSISSDDGILIATPATPNAPGPLALDLRVRWADEAPIRIGGLLRSPAMVRPLDAELLDSAVGRFGPPGGMGLALLETDGSGAQLRFCSGAELACSPATQLALSGGARMVTVPGAAADEVLVVSAGQWFRVAPGQAPRGYAGAVGAEPLDVALAGDCGRAPERLLVLTAAGHALYRMDGARDPAPSPLGDLRGVDLLSSGCVDTFEGGRLRTYVLENDNDETFLVATTGASNYLAEWIAVGGVAGVGVRGEGPLLRAQLELDDFVVSRAALGLYDGELSVEALDADPTSTAPVAVAGADFDGDAQLDLAAILADYDPASGAAELSLYASLDDVVSGERVSGEAPLGDLGLCADSWLRLYAADFDGDGGDDLLIVDDGQECGRAGRVVGLLF